MAAHTATGAMPVAAAVSVRVEDAGVAVRISNDGAPRREPAGGRGIDGMFERVEGAGGTFEVRAGRGFVVQARIPR
jgi:signal transduction histidine kinase